MPPAAQPPPPPESAEPAAPDAAALGMPPDGHTEQDARAEQDRRAARERRAARDRRAADRATASPAEASPGLTARQQPLVKAKPAGRTDPANQQRTAAAFLLAVLSLFGVLGLSNFQRGVYIVAFALVAGAMAIWLAVTAIMRSRRGRTAGPRGAVVVIVIGGVGVLISCALLAGFALFGSQASTFTQCLSGANTIAAQQSCQSQFMRAVKNAGG
jgi:hypothetical protein